MNWADAAHAGVTDAVLVAWAREMWWHVWVRQSWRNYVGMWRKRFEREDRKVERGGDGDGEDEVERRCG